MKYIPLPLYFDTLVSPLAAQPHHRSHVMPQTAAASISLVSTTKRQAADGGSSTSDNATTGALSACGRGRGSTSAEREKKVRPRSRSGDCTAPMQLPTSSKSTTIPMQVSISSASMFGMILGQWWHRLMRSYSSFSRPNAPSFFISDSREWRDHLLHHPNVFSGLEQQHKNLFSIFCGSDAPRWTSHFRGSAATATAYGNGFFGPDPVGLFQHFLSGSNHYLEPTAWLIVFALVDKLHLEHFTVYNALASSGPSSRFNGRASYTASLGTRFYTGHLLRNLFVLYAIAHKWHGECYFTLQYFVDLLPRDLRGNRPSSSSAPSSSSGGVGQLVPKAVASRYSVLANTHCPVVGVLELARVEESFLRLLGHSAHVSPQHILGLMDLFLTPDERSFVLKYVTESSVQRQFVMAQHG